MIKFVKCESDNCKQCCLASGENNICTKRTAQCEPWSRADGKNGHFIRVKYAPRPSKHERLLKALLKSAYVWDAIESSVTCEVSESDYKQLIAIKESMQKGSK